MLTPINKVLINLNEKVQDQINELHEIVQEFKDVKFDIKQQDNPIKSAADKIKKENEIK
jgi:hypothetical protein